MSSEETKLKAQTPLDEAVLAESRRYTRRSFALAAAAGAAGYGIWRWAESFAHNEEMLPFAQRRALLANEAVSKALLPEYPLASTYPVGRAETLRINGVAGLKKDLELDSWRLQVVGMRDEAQHPGQVKDVTAWEYRYRAAQAHADVGHDTKIDPSKKKTATGDGSDNKPDNEQDDNQNGRKPRGMEEAGESDSTLHAGTPGVLLTLAEITKLPRHELVTQFKCIEGWSQIVHWAGVRTADFLEAYPPVAIDGREPKYVYMETPDGDYYVGYDLQALRHPQMLLVTEMMGQPLTQKHGAPLRLHAPTRYGYKQIKRIGLISYTNDKPDDYWTKLGYDWYAGL